MNVLRCAVVTAVIVLAVATDASAWTQSTADLVVTKIADKQEACENETVMFTINVTNLGPDDVPEVSVSDLLPSGLTYQGHNTTAGAYEQFFGLWNVGFLASGDFECLAIVAVIDPGTEGQTLKNVATILENITVNDPNLANNSMMASVQVIPEPATLGLLVLGGLVMLRFGSLRNNRRIKIHA